MASANEKTGWRKPDEPTGFRTDKAAAHKELPDRYSGLLDAAPIGFVLINARGKVVEWNRAQEQLTGIAFDDAYLEDIWNLYPADGLYHQLQLLLEGSIPQYTREQEIFPDGGEKKFLKSHFYSIISEGQAWVGNFNMDISEVIKTNNTLQESEEKLRAVLDNSDQVFILVDHDLRVMDYNVIARQFVKTLFGNELRKKQKLQLRGEGGELIEHIKLSLRGKNVSTEKCFKLASKSEYWMEYRISPVFDRDKNITGAYFNAFEINKTKRAEREIKYALEKEIELNTLKSQFISTVSHEFRTPLANIILNTQLVEKKALAQQDEKIAKGFKRIYNSIEYLVNMLNEISLISKDQSGKLKYVPASLDLVALCMEIIEQLQSLKPENERIVFNTRLSASRHVLGDKDLLSHIFQNLLNNALKYSPAEKPVECLLALDDDGFSFSVKDYGIGIPGEDIKYLGEPYHRGTNVGNTKGTGLGMSIVKRCLNLHHGRMEINSTVKQGTFVKVRFPFVHQNNS